VKTIAAGVGDLAKDLDTTIPYVFATLIFMCNVAQ